VAWRWEGKRFIKTQLASFSMILKKHKLKPCLEGRRFARINGGKERKRAMG
jgi:hypothetical protein